MNYNITVIKGDGIGPEIVDEAIKVLNTIASKYQHQFNYERIRLLGSNAQSSYHELNISSIRGGANLPPKAVI